MSNVEYIIKGDTKEFNDCLVCCCGEDKSRAEEILNRMVSNPTDHDKRLIVGHSNLRIAEVPKKNAGGMDIWIKDDELYGVACGLGDAIEIVKRGGNNENRN